MEFQPASQGYKLRALPVQFVQVKDGAILKRSSMELKIAGEHAVEVLEAIFSLVDSGDGGASTEEICAAFSAPARASVAALVRQLEARRILVPVEGDGGAAGVGLAAAESNLDIFYWSFGEDTETVAKHLTELPITIVGVNEVSRRLASALAAVGVGNMQVVDYPLLSNLSLFDEERLLKAEQWPAGTEVPRPFREWEENVEPDSIGCLVATSDFGGLHLMRRWNEFCVQYGCHFLPVVLQNLVGYVGPLVVPGETACFECLRARQNSHMADPETERAAEAKAFEGQVVAGFHPSMASVLGDIAAIELTKFYGGLLVPRLAGRLIEVNLLDTRMRSHRVLKVPRCRVCSPLNKHAATNLNYSVLLPLNQSL